MSRARERTAVKIACAVVAAVGAVKTAQAQLVFGDFENGSGSPGTSVKDPHFGATTEYNGNSTANATRGGGVIDIISDGLGGWTSAPSNDTDASTAQSGTFTPTTGFHNMLAFDQTNNPSVGTAKQPGQVSNDFNLYTNIAFDVNVPAGTVNTASFNHEFAFQGADYPNYFQGALAPLSGSLPPTGQSDEDLKGRGTMTLTMPYAAAVTQNTASSFYADSALWHAEPSPWFQMYFMPNWSNGWDGGTYTIDNIRLTGPMGAWQVDADGSWSASTNWKSGVVTGKGSITTGVSGVTPNAIDVDHDNDSNTALYHVGNATANLGMVALNARRTVTVDVPVELGTLNFFNVTSVGSFGYDVVGSNTITMQSSSGTASIGVGDGTHNITAPVALNTNLSVNIAASSSLTLTQLQSSTVNISKSGGGLLTVNKVVTTGTLAVRGGGKVAIAANDFTPAGRALHMSKVGALSISGAGSKLDVTNNAMIVSSGTLTPVRTAIMSGYNGGGVNAWTGDGIVTSSGTTQNGRSTLIGYAQGDDLNLNTGIGSGHTPPYTLNGQSFSNSSTNAVFKYTYQGDADLDGDVDGNDVGKWALNFTNELGLGVGTLVPVKLWSAGDWDYDGDVDGNDVGKWALNFTNELGETGIALGPPVGGLSAVPEPASLGLLALAALPLVLRRRRRTHGRLLSLRSRSCFP